MGRRTLPEEEAKGKEMKLTQVQKNFIRRAFEGYTFQILEDIYGVPDEMEEIPAGVLAEVAQLLMLCEESEE